ncbi:MAG: alpha/beta hydrolase family protein [Marinicellaceae bacterium]
MKIIKKLLITTILLSILSTPLLAINPIQETDLSDAIKRHESSPLAQDFTIQQATKTARIISVKMAPNGKNLVFMIQEDKGKSLHLLNVETKESTELFQSRIIKSFDWSTDGKILFLQSAQYLAALNPLEMKPSPQIFYRFDDKNEEEFYGVDRSQPQQVLINRKIESRKENNPYHLLRVDKFGNETLLFQDKIKVYDFLFDDTGKLSFIRQPNTKQGKHIIYQLNGVDKKPVFSCIVIDKCRMVKFDNKEQELYLMGFGEYKFRSLYTVDIYTGMTELIHQDPEQLADLINVILDEKSGEVLQLDYHSDELKHYGLNENYENHFRKIESQLLGRLSIVASKQSQQWLVAQRHSVFHHNKYHIYDTNTQQLEPILEQQRDMGGPLSSEKLVENMPITYTASDGMVLYGYLLLPKGRILSEVPLLTYAHGGPFNRNSGGYSPMQFIVNQGYAIFQPNFRASTGYGIDYMLAGKAQFSTRVQQDIIEGINYILDQGIGDKSKMGVFGHSFGGYSVLSLMSQYPDVFKAGVATAPGTNLLDLLKKMDDKRINEYDGLPLKNALAIKFADLNNDKIIKKIEFTSPVNTWPGINKPLLIWGGRLDQRIPITHLRDFALKLKQAGKHIEFIEDKKVGHNPPKNDKLTPQAML